MKHFEKWFIIAFVGATLATSCVDDIKFGDAFLEKAPSVAVTQDTIFGKSGVCSSFFVEYLFKVVLWFGHKPE